jgi:hypothetical protein
VRSVVVLAGAVVLFSGSTAIAGPYGTSHELGPSTSWVDDAPSGALVRGPIWSDAAAATMPPPTLDARIDTSDGLAIVHWALRLRPTVTRATSARFDLGGGRGASISVDGHVVPQAVDARTLVVSLTRGSHDVVVEGEAGAHVISHITEGEEFLSYAGLDVRHLALATPSSVEAVSIVAEVPRASIVAAPTKPNVARVVVHAPPSWFLDDRSEHANVPCVPRGYTESTARCEVPGTPSVVREGWRELDSWVSTENPMVVMEVEARSPLRHHVILDGGPIIGVGGALGAGDGFRMRLGYEAGFLGTREITKRSWPGSLVADTDFTRSLVLAATVKHVSTLGLFGLGLGVPVRVLPDVATGLRIEGDFFLGPLGFVISGDVWMFAPVRPRGTVTLLGAISF